MSIYLKASYEVQGLVLGDETFEKQKKIWRLCEEIGVSIPDEVMAYFDHANPRFTSRMKFDISSAVERTIYNNNIAYQVDLEKIPSNVKFIRFIIKYKMLNHD